MAQIFYNLIVARPQLKTFSQVPASWQERVHVLLLANGYDDNGDKIVA